MGTRAVLAMMALAATIGCGRSEQQEAEEAARQIQEGAEAIARSAEQAAESSSEEMARGFEQMARGFQQLAQGQEKAVDFELLKAALPEVNGWARAEVRGEEQTMAGLVMSRAEAQYRRGDSRIDLEITDSAMSQLLLAPLSMFLASGYSERSDDGFKRAAKIGAHPGIEDWNTSTRRGEVTAVVGNRFIVQATGHDVDDIGTVRQVVEAVDLGKLAALK